MFLNKEFWARKRIIKVGDARRIEATLPKCTADTSGEPWDVSGQREDPSVFLLTPLEYAGHFPS